LFIVEREYSSNAYQGIQNVEKEMNTQPEALRLAQMFDGLKFTVVGLQNALPMEEAAAELRRLHEENTALRQTIEYAKKQEHHPWCDYLNIMLTSLPPQKAKCNCKQAQPEQAEKQEPVAWRSAAIRLGEELSSVGCDNYYNLTAEQWLDWALAQEPRGKNSLPTPHKEWVGLTDEEIAQTVGSPIDEVYLVDFRKVIEKLRSATHERQTKT